MSRILGLPPYRPGRFLLWAELEFGCSRFHNADVDLRADLAAAERRWSLRIGGRMTGGFGSDVFAARTAGSDVVLKISATEQHCRAEAAALQAWNDSGAAVHLLDFSAPHRALLLERLRPGGPLPEASAAAVAELLLALHGACVPEGAFPTVEQAYPERERRAREDLAYERRSRQDRWRGEAGRIRLGAARAAAAQLSASAPTRVLLHGDALRKNILAHGSGYRAIDPLPMIGDPCADVGFWAAGEPPNRILSLARVAARRMRLEPRRAQRWALVWVVQQTTQAWREDQAELEAFLPGADELLTG